MLTALTMNGLQGTAIMCNGFVQYTHCASVSRLEASRRPTVLASETSRRYDYCAFASMSQLMYYVQLKYAAVLWRSSRYKWEAECLLRSAYSDNGSVSVMTRAAAVRLVSVGHYILHTTMATVLTHKSANHHGFQCPTTPRVLRRPGLHAVVYGYRN